VKLGAAICNPADFDATNPGNLTAVIHYCTPYFNATGTPINLSFALGIDNSVNTIFGLYPCYAPLNANILHSCTLTEDIPITCAAFVVGLPPTASLMPQLLTALSLPALLLLAHSPA
jgi:hypothetical protein